MMQAKRAQRSRHDASPSRDSQASPCGSHALRRRNSSDPDRTLAILCMYSAVALWIVMWATFNGIIKDVTLAPGEDGCTGKCASPPPPLPIGPPTIVEKELRPYSTAALLSRGELVRNAKIMRFRYVSILLGTGKIVHTSMIYYVSYLYVYMLYYVSYLSIISYYLLYSIICIILSII